MGDERGRKGKRVQDELTDTGARLVYHLSQSGVPQLLMGYSSAVELGQFVSW